MKKKSDKIVLVGGGGHCCSVIDVIEQQGLFEIEGIIDLHDKIGQNILGYKIFASDEDFPLLVQDYHFFHITLGYIESPKKRINIFKTLKELGAEFPKIISPLAYVSAHAIVGEGTVVMHMAQVNPNARIGENCIINSKALIEHDAIVNNHCHISTGAIINGAVSVGEASFIGSGAVTKQCTSIPPFSFIKANSIVK